MNAYVHKAESASCGTWAHASARPDGENDASTPSSAVEGGPMNRRVHPMCALAAAIMLYPCGAAEASDVMHMTLLDLVARADRIVRGTVLA